MVCNFQVSSETGSFISSESISFLFKLKLGWSGFFLLVSTCPLAYFRPSLYEGCCAKKLRGWQVSHLSCIDLHCFHGLEVGVATVFPKLHCHSEICYFVIPTRKATSSVQVLWFNTSHLSPFYSQAFPPHTDWQTSVRLWGPKELRCTVFLPVPALFLQVLRQFAP